jgi:hypothetical protein
VRPPEPRPDAPVPRPAEPGRALAWGAAAVALVVVTASHVLFLVATADGGEAGMAFSWFVSALLTPLFAYAAWRCTRRAVDSRRPGGAAAPAWDEPSAAPHASLRPDAPPAPRRW